MGTLWKLDRDHTRKCIKFVQEFSTIDFRTRDEGGVLEATDFLRISKWIEGKGFSFIGRSPHSYELYSDGELSVMIGNTGKAFTVPRSHVLSFPEFVYWVRLVAYETWVYKETALQDLEIDGRELLSVDTDSILEALRLLGYEHRTDHEVRGHNTPYAGFSPVQIIYRETFPAFFFFPRGGIVPLSRRVGAVVQYTPSREKDWITAHLHAGVYSGRCAIDKRVNREFLAWTQGDMFVEESFDFWTNYLVSCGFVSLTHYWLDFDEGIMLKLGYHDAVGYYAVCEELDIDKVQREHESSRNNYSGDTITNGLSGAVKTLR